jgi:2-polyprenyl-3-methyl-5-hydroxy-6-metoxy-1,4-benzoquinol methylase
MALDNDFADIRATPYPTCILCGSSGTLIYKDLKDHLFGAGGTWNFRKCTDLGCGLIWLDPMPIAKDMGKAYRNYYTHITTSQHSTSLLRTIKEQSQRHWLSVNYGYPVSSQKNSRFVSTVSRFLAHLWRGSAASNVRFLPFVEAGRLLDIGCGSGAWLVLMKGLGWEAEGIDFDPQAVDAANKAGLRVHAGVLEDQKYPSEHFDALTMSHVIEHVPDPIATITECYRLLKPNGRLVLFTPNTSSLCHYYFGQDWRGLEPPRHLHIFSFTSMRRLFAHVGFSKILIRPHIGPSVTYESYLLRQTRKGHGGSARNTIGTKILLRAYSVIGNCVKKAIPEIGEVLAVVAVK